jgi:aldose 1-epimerase
VKKIFLLLFMLFAMMSQVYCQLDKKVQNMIDKKLFGKLSDGNEVYAYTLKNQLGMQATIIEFGATVVSLVVPDRNRIFSDVVLGCDDVQQYANGTTYLGAIVGRYGNRIGKGKFFLQERQYQLSINNGENHLHGGAKGFDKVLWKAEPIESTTD